MARPARAFPVCDIDSHVYEPEEIWDRYVPGEQRAAAKAALWHSTAGGVVQTVLNGQPVKNLNRARLVRQAVWRPGLSPEDIGDLDPFSFHALNPGAFNSEARLLDMDEMGVDQAILCPTIFAEYFPLIEDPNAAKILAQAYNNWIHDFCSRAPERLHPVAVLPLQNLHFAREELDRVAALGFRGVFVRPMFYPYVQSEERGPQAKLLRVLTETTGVISTINKKGEFLTDAHFGELWRHIEETGLVACVHPSSGSASPEGISAGTFMERVAERMNIGHNVAESVGPLQDTSIMIVAMCFHGLLEDFPGLRMALLHSGASLLPLVLEKAETYLWLSFSDVFGITKPVSLEPHDVFARHPLAVGFDSWDRAIGRVLDEYETWAAWGSRYPHHDAAGPDEAIEMLRGSGASEETVARLLGGKTAELFGLPVPAAVR